MDGRLAVECIDNDETAACVIVMPKSVLDEVHNRRSDAFACKCLVGCQTTDKNSRKTAQPLVLQVRIPQEVVFGILIELADHSDAVV